MSRQPHLPPRCPFQRKPISHLIHESNLQHHKSPSQDSILEEQPSWFDDLLNDQELNSRVIFHRWSASDSLTLLDGLANSFSSLNPHNVEDHSTGNETSSQLESASMYGPNSPRERGNVTFSESAIASVLSEYAFRNPLQDVDGSLCISGGTHSGPKEDACGSASELNAETKTVKRHSGQRSRVRKLQYIAELERTVDVFQTLDSELAVRVASLLQKRASLSIENSQLKQQMARLRQQKLIMEGQYKSLKREVERLRNILSDCPNSKAGTYFGSSPTRDPARSEVRWQMLDMEKLNLN